MIPRILAWPFILCLCILAAIRDSLLIVRYGGEIFLYKKGDIKMISDIYQELKSKRQNDTNK